MLSLMNRTLHDCERVSRRGLLQLGALSGLGLSLPGFLAARSARAAAGHEVKDRNCILIWTRGGTSHHDTFDPKPQAPVSVKGEFGVIDTAVPGVQFTEIVPNMARELNRFAVLRSWNPQNASHGVADQYVMSGRKFNAAVPYPTFGSVVSWHKGFRSALPPFVQLGTQVDQRFGGGSAGILGLEHNPFTITADPNSKNFTVRDISFPSGVDRSRIDRRKRMLTAIDELQKQSDVQPDAFDALDEHFRTALNMITAPETKRAFDIGTEEDSLRDAYGRNTFGQNALLARRLIESGVRFVTITDGGWDTHQNNFKSLKDRRVPAGRPGDPCAAGGSGRSRSAREYAGRLADRLRPDAGHQFGQWSRPLGQFGLCHHGRGRCAGRGCSRCDGRRGGQAGPERIHDAGYCRDDLREAGDARRPAGACAGWASGTVDRGTSDSRMDVTASGGRQADDWPDAAGSGRG